MALAAEAAPEVETAAVPPPADTTTVAPQADGTAAAALPAGRPSASGTSLAAAAAGAASGRSLWRLALGIWALLVVLTYLSPAAGHLNPYLTLTGVLVGFLVGLTGMGGGALMTPILILLFGFTPTMAIGTDIAYAAITKYFGSWRHLKQHTVDLPLALWLALGSVPAGLLGASAVHRIGLLGADTVNAVLLRVIGVALIVVAALLILRLVMKVPCADRTSNLPLSARRKAATVAIGATTGFIIGLTSVGSGTLLAMFLILFYPIASSRIVGTDVFHATILLSATGLAQFHYGNVDVGMVAALLMGSVPGVIAGSHLTVRTPTKALRVCLAVVLFLSGLAMLGKA